ncbi:MAG: BatA domain-containing protein, partial [Planctomycetales bacterium]|nr:BatA domain-containing protein [Planctomycetales bacterium]
MGWLFINAGFLAAGAAALTLPIWIHLMLRQRARPMEIGSVRFLQAVVRRTKRRQRIRRWLLLALRCAAMFLLGLLFARPFLPSAPADGRTREAVVLVDRSASMWAAGDDRDAAFEKARRAAKESITALGENARLHIA